MLSRAATIATCFAVAALSGAIIVHEQDNSAASPAQSGHDYLQSLGYSDITAGNRLYMWPACGKNSFAREYTATINGQRVTQKVCLDVAGPRLPSR